MSPCCLSHPVSSLQSDPSTTTGHPGTVYYINLVLRKHMAKTLHVLIKKGHKVCVSSSCKVNPGEFIHADCEFCATLLFLQQQHVVSTITKRSSSSVAAKGSLERRSTPCRTPTVVLTKASRSHRVVMSQCVADMGVEGG